MKMKRIKITSIVVFLSVFLWANISNAVEYVIIDLGTLGGTSSAATDINDSGQIVGSSKTSTGYNHAFLYDNGVMTDLGTLGGNRSNANAINDTGQIAGNSFINTGEQHAVLWKPVSAPVADFTADPISGVYPLTVNFTDQSTGNITSWEWEFGDGETSTNQNPTHTYEDPGIYTVELTVTGPGGTDTETKADYIVVEHETPVANFTADNTIGDAPLTVNFSDESTGIIDTWKWDFGDDSPLSNEQNPTHTYEDPGTYTVSLTVTGPGGSDTETKENLISVDPGLGDELAVDFGPKGLWCYDSSSWTHLASWNPGGMVDWTGGLAVDFGVTYGLWNYNGTAWSQLAGWNSEDIIGVDLY